ncbi:MAG TPA: coproporphyrinogen III oxidase [Corynebacterium nuruki]|uniref:Heme chaperone HemW n=1 Tax=Corynebacterium nuruki TaxID=1032851 RepID=A0A3D4T1I7_9CORY|nr:coproporphyrinogen III oxidase [Corynebacterium nuruki]
MTDSGLYIHVPFCTTRCGYCDFNTYTPGQSGSSSVGTYLDALEAELERAAADWDRPGPPDTVFLGGGTPSLLGADGLTRVLNAVRRTLGLAPGAEVTTESNPESTSPAYFEALLEAGYTRVSLGMQSAAAHVLRVLDRTHTPGRATDAAREALAAGFGHVNLDLIYGTPTETDDDLRRTLDAALATGVDHISAYSLIVEDGTAMGRRVRRGELPMPDEDVLADRYQIIDSALVDAGMGWYEVSNWSRPGGECRHNLVYCREGEWWGAGPGAHGLVTLTPDAAATRGVPDDHVTPPDGAPTGVTRLVNAKLPRRYAGALSEGRTPVVEVEHLGAADRHTEKIMLGLRLREGVPARWLDHAGAAVARHTGLGLLERVSGAGAGAGAGAGDGEEDRIRVTDAGRLLADGVITDILLAEETDAQ